MLEYSAAGINNPWGLMLVDGLIGALQLTLVGGSRIDGVSGVRLVE